MGCYNSIVINKPTEEVWTAFKDFHDLSWSKNVITKVDKIGDKSTNEIGAQRILNDAFHETLLSYDDDAKNLTYSIDDGPDVMSKDNVEGYVGEVTVFSVTENNSSFVLWTSGWKSAKVDGIADFCKPYLLRTLTRLKEPFFIIRNSVITLYFLNVFCDNYYLSRTDLAFNIFGIFAI